MMTPLARQIQEELTRAPGRGRSVPVAPASPVATAHPSAAASPAAATTATDSETRKHHEGDTRMSTTTTHDQAINEFVRSHQPLHRKGLCSCDIKAQAEKHVAARMAVPVHHEPTPEELRLTDLRRWASDPNMVSPGQADVIRGAAEFGLRGVSVRSETFSDSDFDNRDAPQIGTVAYVDCSKCSDMTAVDRIRGLGAQARAFRDGGIPSEQVAQALSRWIATGELPAGWPRA